MNNDKALFCFVDGLLLQLQVWVRTRKPQMLQDAMQIAEEVGSTLDSASLSSQMKKNKHFVAVPVYVGHHQRNGDYAVPMELGAAMKFTGKCYLCGKPPTASTAKQLHNQLPTVLKQVSSNQSIS